MTSIALPTRSSIVSAIKSSIAHSSLPIAKSLHAHVLKIGFFPETLLSNHLLNMYSKCHSLVDAYKLFEEMPDRNLVSYSTLISSASRSGDPLVALDLMSQLQKQALCPNQFVFSSSILACSKLGSSLSGKQLHAQVIVSGFESDPFVKTTLIDMYSKFGDPGSAILVFGGCSLVDDPVMLNSMVSSYVSFRDYDEAFRLFGEARRRISFKPTEFSFGSLLKASSGSERVVGEQLHGYVIKTGFNSNYFIGTSLVDMYGNLGDMECLEKVSKGISSIDTALYNAMIVGSSKNGFDEIALGYFSELRLVGLTPNECSFSSALKACGGLDSYDLGRIIHGLVEKSNFRQDLIVNTALIHMYMEFGKVEESCRVFDCMPERNTISYNSMISGHGRNGNSAEALSLFNDMNRRCLDTDLVTFITLMSSSSGHELSVYVHAVKHGFGADLMVENAVLDGLIKQGAVQEALGFFKKMKETNVISWTTMISGLSQLGLHTDAIELFKTMISSSISPNSFTFSSVFKACGNLAAMEQGKCLHACGVKHGVMDEFTNSSLLDMYARCGDLVNSRRLFNKLSDKDTVAWNIMITGYAQHGYGHEALKLYDAMEKHNADPTPVTFVSLLSACSRCGLVQEGVEIFDSMVSKHGILPCMEHYACMVDMFGRAGMLDRAKNLIDGMPFEANPSVWTVFLAACKLHSNVELAQLATECLMRLRGENKPTKVLMSNVYSEVGKWDDAEKQRMGMESSGARKEPGISWLHTTKETLFASSVT